MTKITIGIPSYNEASNLVKLIPTILKQKGVNIEAIIISSDGSTDNTMEVIKSFSNKKIKLIHNKERAGISRGLNQIIEMSKSEVLVTLDADIQIEDTDFIKKLTSPLTHKGADLTSASISPLKPNGYCQNMLYQCTAIKKIIFNNFNNGNNIYTCYGLARGFTKKFYKTLYFPISIGNDMYTYLKCQEEGYKFYPVNNTTAYYQLPNSFRDYERQSIRFYKSLKKQTEYFDILDTRKHTKIPTTVYIQSLKKILNLVILNPTYILNYILLQVYFKIKSIYFSQPETWVISESTKLLTNNISK